jgi:hypothetical protein
MKAFELADLGPPRDPDGHGHTLLAALAVGLVLLAATLTVFVLTPPPDHVAPGCLWWTAKPVDQVAAGDRGCFRGYFLAGGGLAASRDSSAYALHMDQPSRACRMQPGDAAVVLGEAAYGDGRMVILVDRCR